jgi:hypothetical protein
MIEKAVPVSSLIPRTSGPLFGERMFDKDSIFEEAIT